MPLAPGGGGVDALPLSLHAFFCCFSALVGRWIGYVGCFAHSARHPLDSLFMAGWLVRSLSPVLLRRRRRRRRTWPITPPHRRCYLSIKWGDRGGALKTSLPCRVSRRGESQCCVVRWVGCGGVGRRLIVDAPTRPSARANAGVIRVPPPPPSHSLSFFVARACSLPWLLWLVARPVASGPPALTARGRAQRPFVSRARSRPSPAPVGSGADTNLAICQCVVERRAGAAVVQRRGVSVYSRHCGRAPSRRRRRRCVSRPC